MTKALILQLVSFIDLTTLDSKDNEHSVLRLIEKANKGVEGVHPAAICVFPNFAKFAVSKTQIPVAVVAGCFPTGQTFLEAKTEEIRLASESEASEIDIVINRGKVIEGDLDYLRTELSQCREASGQKHLKVILESGELDDENIRSASRIALEEGADFIKTSTGKAQIGATENAATIMCEEIKLHYEKTGKKAGFKASGGIRTYADAMAYYKIVQGILGDEWLIKDLFRIGASSLYDNLAEDIATL